MWYHPREIVRAYACAIEPTHVHLLIGPVLEDIGRFVGRLKGTTSSALVKHPDNRGRQRIWTASFWKVFLLETGAIMSVQGYIQDHNERAGPLASPYEWLTPM
jgi:REP element-mobilizing transposase RayT